MADPQVLYIVAAVVVLGLVAWVIVVLLRPAVGKRAPVGSGGETSASHAPVLSSTPSGLRRTDRPRLDSHAEIADEPSARRAREAREAEERAGAEPKDEKPR